MKDKRKRNEEKDNVFRQVSTRDTMNLEPHSGMQCMHRMTIKTSNMLYQFSQIPKLKNLFQRLPFRVPMDDMEYLTSIKICEPALTLITCN